MKFRRTLRFHGLKRPKVRPTWNKFNLYNLARQKIPYLVGKTFFQQKWAAKAMSRAYHGEHIKEHQWERMFSRRLLSVVNMNPKYMAAYDGSEQATGRGSGREVPLEEDKAEAGIVEEAQEGDFTAAIRPTNMTTGDRTPYMQMTFAPQERRLDVAVWRALFASSARQARQFVVHGAVKVNGQEMRYPGYLLNPGDMFQVDVERVKFATGAPKGRKRVRAGKGAAEPEEAEEAAEEAAPEADASAESAEVEVTEVTPEQQVEELKEVLKLAKEILSDGSVELSVKRKKQLREFAKDARSAISRAGKTPSENDATKAGGLVDDLTDLLASMNLASPAKGEESAAAAAQGEKQDVNEDVTKLTNEEKQALTKLLQEEAENPYDPSKPYLTPWRPRPYMSPFAFIPRYLEVNQNICAAVYLRHPVARPGYGEVPTPFPPNISQLAFNWYLRRR